MAGTVDLDDRGPGSKVRAAHGWPHSVCAGCSAWARKHRRPPASAGPGRPIPEHLHQPRGRRRRRATLARLVGERLGWKVYDEELVEAIAHRMEVPIDEVRALDEQAPSMVQDWLLPLREEYYAPQEAYLDHLAKLIEAIGRAGESILVGRGAGFMLPRETTLSLRVIAPLKVRAQRLAERMGVSVRTARRAARDLDRRRAQFDRTMHRANPTTRTTSTWCSTTSEPEPGDRRRGGRSRRRGRSSRRACRSVPVDRADRSDVGTDAASRQPSPASGRIGWPLAPRAIDPSGQRLSAAADYRTATARMLSDEQSLASESDDRGSTLNADGVR